MKKQLFFALAALGMLASCSNNELLNSVENIQPEPQSIGFSGFVNKSTRTEMNLSNLKEAGFNVWGGFKNSANEVGYVFTKQEVAWNSTDMEWQYSPLRYWTLGNAYAFTAVAPMNNTAWSYTHTLPTETADFTAKRHGKITFTQPSDGTPGTIDLILASAIVPTAAANQSAVSLQFNHLLSRVNFRFTNGFGSANSYITVENVTLTTDGGAEIDLTGYNQNAAVNTMQWGNYSGSCTTSHLFDTSSSSSKFNNATTTNSGSGTTTSAYVIPTKDKVTIAFTARLYNLNADNDTYTEQSPNTGWSHSVTLDLKDITSTEVMVPGYSYTFVAELNEDNIGDDALKPIKFNAAVTNWADYTELPYIVFNASSVDLTAVGATFQLLHGVDDLSVSYSSTNESVATVSNTGLITAVAAGTCKIKANASGYQETIIDVTVTSGS